MARTKKQESPATATPADPHYGHGGSFRNEGGDHDTRPEPARELVERTEDQVIRHVDDVNKPAEPETASTVQE